MESSSKSSGKQPASVVSASQKSFWQAVTVGDLETVQCLLENEDVDVNMYDMEGDQRQGGMSLHLAILEMPTWKGSEGRNGIQTAEYVRKFIQCLLDHGADIHKICRYKGEWYLQTAAGKTKTFFPDGYDSLGVVLQFIEITRGAEVIASDVTKRLELIRDMLLHQTRLLKRKCKAQISTTNFDCMRKGLGNMLARGAYSDLELSCGGRTFQTHKVILAARSTVFDRMFSSRLSESKKSSIEIKEVKPEILSAFLDFVYTEQVKLKNLDLTPELMEFANRYDVQPLKARCGEILADNLRTENAIATLSLADRTQAFELKELALNFIAANVKDVFNTKEFEELDGELMREIVKALAGGQKKRVGGATSARSHKRQCKDGVSQNKSRRRGDERLGAGIGNSEEGAKSSRGVSSSSNDQIYVHPDRWRDSK